MELIENAATELNCMMKFYFRIYIILFQDITLDINNFELYSVIYIIRLTYKCWVQLYSKVC